MRNITFRLNYMLVPTLYLACIHFDKVNVNLVRIVIISSYYV